MFVQKIFKKYQKCLAYKSWCEYNALVLKNVQITQKGDISNGFFN